MYKGESGTPEKDRQGQPIERKPLGIIPNCLMCKKFPDDTPIPQRNPTEGRKATLSERNRQAVRHYLECRAVGHFPDDPLVRSHAVLLRELEDGQERAERRQLAETVAAFLGALVR